MQIIRGYKVELDPNDKQATMMNRCCGASRYVYNWGLAEWQRQYEAGENPCWSKLCVQFNAVKDDVCPWIREIPYAVVNSAFINLGTAYKNFFRQFRNNGTSSGYPKPKRSRNTGSFQLKNTRVEIDRVRLTHIGWVKLKRRAYIPTNQSGAEFGTYATVSKKAGRWYVSVTVKEEIPESENDSMLVIGVDLGINSLAVCSDGTIYQNPRPLQDALCKLKRTQRELARREKGSSNWQKTRDRLSKQYATVTDTRKHALHNVSHDIVVNKRPKTIVLEDLSTSNMMQNHHLAQAIMDSGFRELRRQIEYKASWNGVQVIIANQWFPSSKTCSNCGSKKETLKLSQRTFVCSDCGIIIDRDLNAARNLAAIGVEP